MASLSGGDVPAANGSIAGVSTDMGLVAAAAGTGEGGGKGAAAEAVLALRRAAFTGALEKPPPGSSTPAGEAEAQKETFWRGHAKVTCYFVSCVPHLRVGAPRT